MNEILISPGKNNVGAYINNLNLNLLKQEQTIHPPSWTSFPLISV